ncbi:type II secretion system protein GspM [Fretibacter rubidus]|uniref:type II secretion system protein GspM n=1 Tax=Fretibacter rubidus TaxID=570162 RepID=UPI00352B87C5
MNYFVNLSRREQLLVITAGVLFAVFALWQFALSPVMTGKAQAESAHAHALRDMDIVSRAAPLIGQTGVSKARADFDRAAAITQAGQAGLSITRVQPTPDGDIKIWFDESLSTDIYSFLSRLTRDYAVSIERADIKRKDGGFVSAQITLRSTS